MSEERMQQFADAKTAARDLREWLERAKQAPQVESLLDTKEFALFGKVPFNQQDSLEKVLDVFDYADLAVQTMEALNAIVDRGGYVCLQVRPDGYWAEAMQVEAQEPHSTLWMAILQLWKATTGK